MTTDTLKQKEKSEEARQKLADELRFKADARCNKLLGLWAAPQIGLTGDAALKYAKDLVLLDLDLPGHGGVIKKVLDDLTAKGVSIDEAGVMAERETLFNKAMLELSEEYPMPLGNDHERVGD